MSRKEFLIPIGFTSLANLKKGLCRLVEFHIESSLTLWGIHTNFLLESHGLGLLGPLTGGGGGVPNVACRF